MTRRLHTRMTAWLGLLALWLGVLAPVVTQMLAAHERVGSVGSIGSIGLFGSAHEVSLRASFDSPRSTAHPASRFAPVAAPFADLCSTHAARPSALSADDSRGSAPQPARHDNDKSCGYCGFFAHHVPLSGGVFGVPGAAGIDLPSVRSRALGIRPAERYSPCRPRGPPADVSIFIRTTRL